MDINTGVEIAKKAGDIISNDSISNKTVGVFGMLFPFVGIKRKAVDMYVEDIQKSNLPRETKVALVLDAKHTFKKIKNQESVADKAVNYAKLGTDFSEKSGVSEEWLDRFMDSAGFVSSEDMQVIWGKILANEFERAGSTPPNMIRILSEITPKMARAFSLICSMSVNVFLLSENGEFEDFMCIPVILFKDEEKTLNEMELGFEILNELESLGLIKFNGMFDFSIKNIMNKQVLIHNDNDLELVEKHRSEDLPVGNVLLTASGETLMSIIDKVKIEGYFEKVKEYMNNKKMLLTQEHEWMVKESKDGFSVIKKKNQFIGNED